MPIPVTDRIAFEQHLEALGLRSGMTVIVHSRLLSFGRLLGGEEMVQQAIERVIGRHGTIVVPTYTLRLDSETVYDRHSTPGQGMGSFSEYVRKLDGAIRSRCPMHNHTGIGAEAGVLDRISGSVSLGHGSDFEALAGIGGFLLLLGCRFSEGATYLHHVEALAEVPYREWLDLPRKVKADHGGIEDMTCRYFGRVADEFTENFDVVPQALAGTADLKQADCAFSRSSLIGLNALHAAAADMLKHSAFALVKPAKPDMRADRS